MLEQKQNLSHARPLEIAALLPSGVIGGVLTGAAMNIVNGWLSPLYFTTVFATWGNKSATEVWVTSISHGMLEGLGFGIVFAFIFTSVVVFISRLCCPFRLALLAQCKIIGLTFLFWFIGGLNAILIALFWPQFYDNFVGLPSGKANALKFAWVGGSIYGVYGGGMLAVIIGSIMFSVQWQKLKKQESNHY